MLPLSSSQSPLFPTPPKHFAEIQALASVSQSEQDILAALGALVRVCAAARTQGLILELEARHGLLSAWIQDGLHADVPFVIIGPNQAQLQDCERHLPADLRLAFHCQEAARFVEDMSDKSFGLIVDHRQHDSWESLGPVLAILEPGGLFVTRLANGLDLPARDAMRWTPVIGDWYLFARGTPPPTRRGGRRENPRIKAS